MQIVTHVIEHQWYLETALVTSIHYAKLHHNKMEAVLQYNFHIYTTDVIICIHL